MSIEGVNIDATCMLDTGAQSTIISHSALHHIDCRLREVGKKLPSSELSTVRLFGKDGEKGSKELCVTAQVFLMFSTEVEVCDSASLHSTTQ